MYALATCPTTEIVNLTKTWNERDAWSLENAKKRCNEIYPGFPCVKMFRKKQDDIYHVICGIKE